MRIAALVLAGLAMLAASGSIPRAESPPCSAFVRVNQVGYPASATKRAYLMSSVNQAGATFTVQSTTGATRHRHGRAEPRRVEQHLRLCPSARLRRSDIARDVHDRDERRRSRDLSLVQDRHRTRTSTRLRSRTGCPSTRRNATARTTSRTRCAPRPAHLNDQNAMTYVTPHANSAGRFSGDLQALGVRIDASGGWWDAGDYIKGVETLGYTTALLLHGVREFPDPVGTGYNAEGEIRHRLVAAHVGRPDADVLLPGRNRLGEREDRRRSRHLAAAAGGRHVRRQRSALPLHPQPSRLPAWRRPARRSARTSPVATRRCSASAIQIFKTSDPAFANRCLLAGVHIFDLANTAPGQLTTYVPYSFYPETEWRSDLELGAAELYLAIASGGAPAGLPHDRSVLPPAGGALGERVHDERRGCGRHAEPLRRQRARALRTAQGAGAGGQSRWARDDAGCADRRPQEGARRRTREGGRRSVPVRLPVGDLGHDVARRAASP